MYTTKDNEGHIKMSLTLTFKVNRQGHVIGFVFFEIPDLEKVKIETEILSVLSINQSINQSIKTFWTRQLINITLARTARWMELK